MLAALQLSPDDTTDKLPWKLLKDNIPVLRDCKNDSTTKDAVRCARSERVRVTLYHA